MELIGGDDIFLDEEAQDKKIPGSIRLKKSKEDKQQSRFGTLKRAHNFFLTVV